jgi:ATP-binding cassette subfamily C exporter for protease/lipase
MKKPHFLGQGELATALWALRREFTVVGLFSMVANVLLLSPTLYMLQIYDRVLVSQSELTLMAVSLITLFFLTVMAISEWSRSRLLVRAGVRLDECLSTRVFNASFEAYLNPLGVNPGRAFGDLTTVRQFITGHSIFTFFDAPWAPVYITVLFFLHPWLGIMAIGFSMVQATLAWWGHHRTVLPSEDATKAQSEAISYLQSKLRNSEVVEAMGMLGNLRQRWQERHEASVQKSRQVQGLNQRLAAWSKFVRYSQQSLVLGVGALLVIDGQLSPGGMIAANVLMARALAPIDQLVSTWRSFIDARTAFERLAALLKRHPERDAVAAQVPPDGEITLQEVYAIAPGRSAPILKGICLNAHPGSINVVLGPSGSGKSTLARVLVGIWPEVAGEVLLDGRPLREWDRAELGPHIGYLPQDIELLDGTIAENISRFREVNSEAVIAATQLAGLHETILGFPNGYDTSIGEAGQLLSGGQRQRIGLARAIYGKPILVVLDEPNANLDAAGEEALLNTVRELRTLGRTVFLITHRPDAIAVADRVLLLRDGEVRMNSSREAFLAALQAARQQPRNRATPTSPLAPLYA